jgi:hypothetical protein
MTNAPTTALEHELLELEHAGWASLCDGTAGVFYGSLMSNDAVMVLANGQVMDRGQVVDALRNAPRWASYTIRDVRLIGAGPAGALLAYTGTATRPDGVEPFAGTMVSHYVRTDAGWRLVLYQQTEIQTEP